MDEEKKVLMEQLLSAPDAPGAEIREKLGQPNPFWHVLDAMPGGFFIYRAGGGEELLYANTAVLRLFGCETMEELLGLTGGSFRGIVYPEDLDRVEESIQRQIESSQYDLDYVEYRICRRDGAIRWVEDYGHFIRSQSLGDVFYVFIGDATEKHQRALEEKNALLQESRKKDQQLQEYHAELQGITAEHLRRQEVIQGLSVEYESIFYVDLDADTAQLYRSSGRVEFELEGDREVRKFNEFAAQYGKRWVHPEDQARFFEAIDRDYIRTKLRGEKLFHINYRVLCGNRTEYLQLRIVNVGPEGAVSQVVLGVRSVDEEIRTELRRREVLEEALEKAKSVVIAKDSFLANMSHDMRTPMNAILGFTELIRKYTRDEPRVQEYLDMIRTSGEQLLQLINGVLEVAHLESGRSTVEERECSLPELVEALCQEMQPQAEKGGVALAPETSGAAGARVFVDGEKLTQVLRQLVGNAIKYTPAGGRAAVRVEEAERLGDRSVYRFVVEDNGVGVSEEFLQHIFEPFERERNTTLSGIYGPGLGLTNARSMVDLMGGTIEAESTLGQGSRFTVKLTLRRAGADPEAERGTLGSESGRGADQGFKILLVEDNAFNRELETEVLEDAGFTVDTAENGLIGVEMLKASRPGEYGLVLMDIQMPVMNGYEAARAIRALPDPELAGVLIIALSANSFEEDRRRSLESGMDAHMGKPIDMDKLLEQIHSLAKKK